MKKHKDKAAPVLVVLVLLVFWEAVVRINQIPLYVLPAPTSVLSAVVTEWPNLLRHGLITVAEALGGMAISLAVALLTGILMDRFPLVKR